MRASSPDVIAPADAVRPHLGEQISLRSGVQRVTDRDGVAHLMSWPHAERLGRLSTAQLDALTVLAGASCKRIDLDGGGPVETLVGHLERGGWLATTITLDGRPLCTFDPLMPPPAAPPATPGEPVLSRFVVIRRRAGELVAESPRAWGDLRIHDPAALGVVSGFPTLLPDDATAAIQRLLLTAGMMCAPGSEEADFRLQSWGAHELWFHDRSRLGHRGSFGGAFGGTHWAREKHTPPVARHPGFRGPAIALCTPDLNALRETDPTLTTVLEDRHSARTHHPTRPLTLEQLGEFLYRTGRTRDRHTRDGFEFTSRPYPSGGSAYELELYPVVTRVDGLDAGMYHYDSIDHRLELVAPADHRAVRRILRVARASLAGDEAPQVLFVISARMGRIAWKYEGMPYSLMLKHVGVLYQTMYCVATAMGLAACGLGGGDSSAFTEATRLHELDECSVGEFALGTHPGTPPRPGPVP